MEIATYRAGWLPQKALTAYLKYQFWDVENNTLPYQVGTYLGTKKVFNVGAGFYHHPKAMKSKKINSAGVSEEKKHDILEISADLFLDLPFNNAKYAFTAYALYNYLYMGPQYLRNIGINNLADGLVPGTNNFNGSGNAIPTIGTGDSYFMQMGVLLPRMGKFGRFQPHVSTTYSNFERIKSPVITSDIGVAWLLNGHSIKLTFAYRTRPVFKYENPQAPYGPVIFDQTKGEFITQIQMYL